MEFQKLTSSDPPVKKEFEKNLKKKIYKATKSSSHQPKVRWAEMGSHSQDFTLSKKQIPSNYHMFERNEGKKVWGSSRGLRADPRNGQNGSK